MRIRKQNYCSTCKEALEADRIGRCVYCKSCQNKYARKRMEGKPHWYQTLTGEKKKEFLKKALVRENKRIHQGYYTIYTLTNVETNNIFYVGRTSLHLNERLSRHLTISKNSSDTIPVRQYIKALKLKPIIESLEEIEEDSDYAEMFWIYQLRQWGFNLLNAYEPTFKNKKYAHSKIKLDEQTFSFIKENYRNIINHISDKGYRKSKTNFTYLLKNNSRVHESTANLIWRCKQEMEAA